MTQPFDYFPDPTEPVRALITNHTGIPVTLTQDDNPTDFVVMITDTNGETVRLQLDEMDAIVGAWIRTSPTLGWYLHARTAARWEQ